jgi:serine protease inhibitor
MHKNKILNVFVIFFIVCLIISCNKKKENNYGVSISAPQMIGTPAEMFSLQHIKMFQASNAFTTNLLPTIIQTSNIHNFAFSPFYLLNNLMIDSCLNDYFISYEKYYTLSPHNSSEMLSTINDFKTIVHKIDSSFNIKSTIEKENPKKIIIKQELELPLLYENAKVKGVDNIFTTIDNKKPRLQYINISGNFNIYSSDEEQVSEVPLGNGNYILMLIKPLQKDIKQYVSCFNEEKYTSLIEKTENKSISISFPLINVRCQDMKIEMPELKTTDSNNVFPKELYVNSSFSLRKATMAELKMVEKDMDNTILSKNNSDIIQYNSPFLFIIRGKNSNLIMFVGWYIEQ